MSYEERKEPTAEELKEAQERWRKVREDSLVEKYRDFERLAVRIVSQDGTRDYDSAYVNHMAEMLLLIDIVTPQSPFFRFRSRYAGNY